MLNLFITALLLSVRTFMHKLLFNDLDSSEYLFLYSIVLLVMSGYICSNNSNSKLWKLSAIQYIIIISSAIISLYIAKISFDIIKNNTISQSNYIIKGMNLIMLVLISKLIFNEELSKIKIFALLLIFIGILLLK